MCPAQLVKGCVVYSLGSNGDNSFEADILAQTECEVFTFDCTTLGHPINARHRYIMQCLGSEGQMQANPQSWTTLEAAMARLGHNKISVLKLDIEGSEYDVFASWKLGSAALPDQIIMEIHAEQLYHGECMVGGPYSVPQC